MPLVNEFGWIIQIVKDLSRIFAQRLIPKCPALICSFHKHPNLLVIQLVVPDVKVPDLEVDKVNNFEKTKFLVTFFREIRFTIIILFQVDKVVEAGPVLDLRLLLVLVQTMIHRVWLHL